MGSAICRSNRVDVVQSSVTISSNDHKSTPRVDLEDKMIQTETMDSEDRHHNMNGKHSPRHSPVANRVESKSKTSLSSYEASSLVRAVSKLRALHSQLEKDELPQKTQMLKSLTYTIDLLSGLAEKSSPIDEIDSDLQDLVPHDEVRAWLASTFTSQDSSVYPSTRPSFKAVVKTIMVGQYFKKMSVAPSVVYPVGVGELFQQQLDNWNCDIFEVERLTDEYPLKHVGHEIFYRNGLLSEFKIPTVTFEKFVARVEDGYKLHGNPYHNATHAADVLQTVHSFIKIAKLEEWFTKLEILALMFSAIIHDVEHTGTTNNFHIQSRSELSLCYNDQSILENYHLNRAYTILKEDDANIFRNLTNEQYTQVRTMTIDMVLSTDMSKHFSQLNNMKRLLSAPDVWDQFEKTERTKLLDLFLHMADISHPGKEWNLHNRWTDRIQEEFFRQGDREKEMGLPCSPLCDRTTIAIPESQIGFINFIVKPSFDVFGDALQIAFDRRGLCPGDYKVWNIYMNENRQNWQDKCQQKVDQTKKELEINKTNGTIQENETSLAHVNGTSQVNGTHEHNGTSE